MYEAKLTEFGIPPEELGFQTLADDSALHYQMTAPYVSEASRGVQWNDPAFDLEWPVAEPILSERDQAWPDFSA